MALPYPIPEAASSAFVSTTAPFSVLCSRLSIIDWVQLPSLIPQVNAAGAFGPNQITCEPPTWFMGGRNLVGQILPGYGPTFAPMGTFFNTT